MDHESSPPAVASFLSAPLLPSPPLLHVLITAVSNKQKTWGLGSGTLPCETCSCPNLKRNSYQQGINNLTCLS
ncbi:hypothetical protein AAC387_Pa05g0337 [Persea americana]